MDTLLRRNLTTDNQDKSEIKNYKKGGVLITDKESEEYTKKRDEYIKKRITNLFNGNDKMNLVLNEKGNVVKKSYQDLSKEQVVEATSAIKSDATKLIKEQLFGKHKETSEEKREDKRLTIARKRFYPNK